MGSDYQNYLAGDIGGTKTLLAIFSMQNKKLVEERSEKFVNEDFESLEAIIEQFLVKDEKIASACFGIAGPVLEGKASMTNLPWVIESEKIKKRFNLKKIALINDLVANAYGIRALEKKDFVVLNRGKVCLEGNQGLVSAGTGLGLCPIYYYNKELVPVSSEGGHADFAPRTDDELDLFRYLQNKYGRVSYERVLSGHGLVNIYNFLRDNKYEEITEREVERMQVEIPSKVIVDLGLLKESKLCERTIEWFCSIYGAHAGNFALMTTALGGIFIGGGIAPKLVDIFKKGGFMEAFFDKGRLTKLLYSIPVQIILEENTALKGAAYYSHNKL